MNRVLYGLLILLMFSGVPSETEMGDPQHLCHILATGVYPTMSITDARCYGSAIGISKKQLWSLFCLDQ